MGFWLGKETKVAWSGGFSGVGFDRTEFRKWLGSQKKPPYHRIVNHMTDAPYTKASVGCVQRIKNLGNYYRNDLGWSGGPDFFVLGDGKVYLGTPMGKSIGCKGWNGNSFHIEVEGKYDGKKHDYASGPGLENWQTSAWVQAELLEWMGWPFNGDRIKLHKEGLTGHNCPGVVPKDWIMNRIAAAQGGTPAASAPVPPAPDTMYVAGVPAGEWLNFRVARAGEIKGKLYNGVKLAVLEKDAVWAKVRTPSGYEGWVALAYLSPVSPASEPPKPAQTPSKPEPETPGLYAPGQARWSEDWCLPMMKKVEGLRLTAYVDKPGWAIGYGHNSTGLIPPIPYEGMTLRNEKEAEDILRVDLDDKLRYINAWVKVPLTQPQVDALVMHIFQQGPTQFRKRLVDLINTGDHARVAKAIESMAHANPGVERRRRFEAARYLGSTSTKW